MKILIIGAGAVSSVLTGYLNNDNEIKEIICGSNNLKSAREFIRRKKKVRLVHLDAANIDSIAKQAKGTDLIINASLPRFNENIMEAALRVGVHYQDLASDLTDLVTAEQLKFNQRFKKAGLKALINTGVAPGLTNMLAKEAADQMDSVDSIRIRCLEDQLAKTFVFAWSAITTIDDITAPPLVYKNGRFSHTKPFADAEEFDFPHPFGIRTAYSIYGDEVATIPHYIKVKNVDFKSAGADIDFSKVLSDLGLFSEKSVKVKDVKVVPLDFFKVIAPDVPSPGKMKALIKTGIIKNGIFALAVEVTGKQEKMNSKIVMSISFPDLQAINKLFPGSTYIAYPTGTAAYAFSKIIPQIKTTGVFPPETLNHKIRHQVMLELEMNGITIEQQFQKK